MLTLQSLIPGCGIWLNTQRPEWNDANIALAGWGLSVVTVCYLRRYLGFLETILDGCEAITLEISEPVAVLLRDLARLLPDTSSEHDDASRWQTTSALGRAGAPQRSPV